MYYKIMLFQDAAVASLKQLNKNDVVEVRAMQRPPDGVKMVIEACCIMKGIKPKRVAGEKVYIISLTFVLICMTSFQEDGVYCFAHVGMSVRLQTKTCIIDNWIMLGLTELKLGRQV